MKRSREKGGKCRRKRKKGERKRQKGKRRSRRRRHEADFFLRPPREVIEQWFKNN
jgi:hypothetical protein